jgi:hypothetical protein
MIEQVLQHDLEVFDAAREGAGRRRLFGHFRLSVVVGTPMRAGSAGRRNRAWRRPAAPSPFSGLPASPAAAAGPAAVFAPQAAAGSCA